MSFSTHFHNFFLKVSETNKDLLPVVNLLPSNMQSVEFKNTEFKIQYEHEYSGKVSLIDNQTLAGSTIVITTIVAGALESQCIQFFSGISFEKGFGPFKMNLSLGQIKVLGDGMFELTASWGKKMTYTLPSSIITKLKVNWI